MCAIINDAEQACKEIIPEDRWQEPYMPMNELEAEIQDGVDFWCFGEKGGLAGVMGMQDKGAVALIQARHRSAFASVLEYPGTTDRHISCACEDQRTGKVVVYSRSYGVNPQRRR
jgi:hypothetical protein